MFGTFPFTACRKELQVICLSSSTPNTGFSFFAVLMSRPISWLHPSSCDFPLLCYATLIILTYNHIHARTYAHTHYTMCKSQFLRLKWEKTILNFKPNIDFSVWNFENLHTTATTFCSSTWTTPSFRSLIVGNASTNQFVKKSLSIPLPACGENEHGPRTDSF
jgi:hypothetical protein